MERNRRLKLNIMENKILNVEVTSEEQRNELIKQLQEMKFKKPLPSSWDEYLVSLSRGDKKIVESDLNSLLTIGLKYRSMYKLEKLMEVYNDGWKADWNDNNKKYVLKRYCNSISKDYFCGGYRLLSFKDAETRDLFLKNFEPLIKQYFEID